MIRATGLRYAGIAAALTVVVIVARIAWVTGAAALSRWRCRPGAGGTSAHRDVVAQSARDAAVVGWCGMHGTVSLAAALALPAAFPHGDLILVTAFGVVLGTLVIQGMTLRPLMRRLGLEDDDPVDREVRLARLESLRAAVAAAAEEDADANGAGTMGEPPTVTAMPPTPDRDGDVAVVRAATEAQRRRLVALRSEGTIGDAAFQRVEEELDWAELDWAQLVR